MIHKGKYTVQQLYKIYLKKKKPKHICVSGTQNKKEHHLHLRNSAYIYPWLYLTNLMYNYWISLASF